MTATKKRQQQLAGSIARPPVDLRSLTDDKLHSQGPRPLCVAFACSTSHQIAIGMATGARVDALAPEALWAHCHYNGQTGPQGTHMVHVSDAIYAVGQPDLGVWPYNPLLGIGTEPEPPSSSTAPRRQASWEEVPLAHDGIEWELEEELARGSAVALIVEVTDEFTAAGTDGFVAVPTVKRPIGDWHAVTVVGAATFDGTRYLLAKNTWTASWGLGGYCWIPLAYLVANAAEAGYVKPPLKTSHPKAGKT